MKDFLRRIVLFLAATLLLCGRGAAQDTLPSSAARDTFPPSAAQETLPSSAVRDTFPPSAAQEKSLLPPPMQQLVWIRDMVLDTLQITRSLQENMPIDPDFNTNREFTLVGKKANYALSMGAVVRVSATSDWNSTGENAFNFHLHGSNIVFNFVGQPKEGHTIGAFIGLGFTETNGYIPQLDHAYVKYNSLTFGRTYTTYNDPIASLFTIDYVKPVASGNGTAFLLRWEPRIKNWRFGVGVEQVRSSYTYAQPDSLCGIDQRIPDGVLYVSYEPSDKWHLRLSGVFRGLEYEKTSGSALRDVAFGWSMKLTGHFNFYPVTGYWMIQGGKGGASFQSGNYGMGMDLIPFADAAFQNSGMRTVLSWGATLGIQVNWTKNLFSVFKGSYLMNDIPVFGDARDSYHSMNRLMANSNVNLMWNINKLFHIGAEYSFSHTQNIAGDILRKHRVWAMVYVSF